MEQKKLNIAEIAKVFASKKGCDIVKEAGCEGEWHYFAYTKTDLPKYGSLPSAVRINEKGEIEELHSFLIRQKVSNRAYQSENS